MAGEGAIRRDSLLWALQLAGYISPTAKWVDELVEQYFPARLFSLSRSEFGELVHHYGVRNHRFLAEKFQQPGSSPITSEAGLSALLREMGLMPLPWSLRELHREALSFSAPGPRSSRNHSEELARVCDLLHEGAGFTRREATELRTVFARCDRDRDGRLDAAGVRAALRWLGAEGDVPKALEPLVAECRTDSGGAKDCGQLGVSEAEFLVLVRACRFDEQRRIYAAFNSGNCDWFGTVDVAELPRIFEEVGVLQASPEILRELLAACGFGHRDELLFDDVCLLRERLRRSHGFADAEVSEIAQAFEDFDHDRSGSVDHAELTCALRWLGYPATVEGIQEVQEELWLNHCRHVYAEDFLRFVAECRNREVLYLRRALERNQGRLPLQNLHGLLKGLGYTVSPEQAVALLTPGPSTGKRPTVVQDGLLGLTDLLRLVSECRNKFRQQVRLDCGLGRDEVAELRKAFSSRDPEETGFITGEDLIEVIRDVSCQRRTAALERLEVVVDNVGGETWGRVEFKYVLKVVRLLHDYAAWDKFRKERRVLSDLGLSREEAEGFREVFDKFGVSDPGRMTFIELRDMLNGIIPEGAAAEDPALRGIAVEAAGEGAVLEGMDFPDFLRVMLALLAENWLDINSYAGKIAREARGGRRNTLWSPH